MLLAIKYKMNKEIGDDRIIELDHYFKISLEKLMQFVP